MYGQFCRNEGGAGFSAKAGTSLFARFRQELGDAGGTSFSTVGMLVDCLVTNPERRDGVDLQPSGDLFGRPSCLKLVDDVAAEIDMAHKFALTLSPPASALIGCQRKVAFALAIFPIVEAAGFPVCLDFVARNLTVDRRAMPPERFGDHRNWVTLIQHAENLAALIQVQMRIGDRHSISPKCKHLKNIVFRTSELNPPLNPETDSTPTPAPSPQV